MCLPLCEVYLVHVVKFLLSRHEGKRDNKAKIREKRIDSIILASLAFDFGISRILERVVYCLHPELIPSVLGADRKILRIVG